MSSEEIVYRLIQLKRSSPWQLLLRIQEYILFITTCAMVTILGLVVVCRYVLRVDFFGFDEIVMISAFWMYFIGSSYAMEKREHVKVDLLDRMLPLRGQRILRIFADVVQVLVALETMRLSIAYIINGINIWPTTSAWGIPLITSMCAVTVGFVLMAFYVVVQLLEDIYENNGDDGLGMMGGER